MAIRRIFAGSSPNLASLSCRSKLQWSSWAGFAAGLGTLPITALPVRCPGVCGFSRLSRTPVPTRSPVLLQHGRQEPARIGLGDAGDLFWWTLADDFSSALPALRA